MLMQDRTKYVGILVGLSFASLLMTQQAGIFLGLMNRTFGFISDTGYPQLWIMDPHTSYIDDTKSLADSVLHRVRGIEGVAWAVPLYRGFLQARLPDGNLQLVTVIGIDDATLIGGPPVMLKGSLSDLHLKDAVLIDMTEAKGKLVAGSRLLDVGDEMEINDRRAVIVGTAKNRSTFRSQPTIYTTYSRALQFAPPERRLMSFVLAGVLSGEELDVVASRIQKRLGLKALSAQQFKNLTYDYYMRHTGIPVNFGTAVVLGLLVGMAIAGQMFYQFVMDNLRHFSTLKAMGASHRLIGKMIVLQALVVGGIGYGLGVGLASLTGLFLQRTALSFHLSWPLLGLVGLAILGICLLCALHGMNRVFRHRSEEIFR